MNTPGQITDQIVEEISTCKYGICYLSEYATKENDPTGSLMFVDNSNVLIEAGMLDVLTHNRLASTTAWIPVREDNRFTETTPFDFSAERMIVVPRDDKAAFQQDDFEDLLRDRIEAMLDWE